MKKLIVIAFCTLMIVPNVSFARHHHGHHGHHHHHHHGKHHG